jgi:RHS repeat-associated protein
MDSGLMDYKARLYDPTIGHFIQPDTIISDPADPQSWNRYSYVLNRPLVFADPTGHFEVEGSLCSSLSCADDPLYDLNHDADSEDTETNPPSIPAALGALFDFAAFGTNFIYAAVGYGLTLVFPPMLRAVLDAYQLYSLIPNSLSTLALLAWAADGVITGENSLSISAQPGHVGLSMSVSQDTIVTGVTTYAGWTVLREPAGAFLVDAGVLAYDSARVGVPGTQIRIDPFVNPTLSYYSDTGFSWSWVQE